jgi:hypothetical protein
MAASQTAPTAGTILSNSYGPGSVSGEREDISPVINRIDPDSTPFYSNCRKGVSKAVIHDWLVQELKAPVTLADRAQPEGFEATITAHVAPVRHTNTVQIFADTTAVSDTMDAVDKVGRASELQYQKVLSGLERRVEVNATLLDQQVNSGVQAAPTVGTLASWMTNGEVIGSGTMPTGDGSDLPTGGTPAAFTLAMISNAQQEAYEDGGSPRIMYMSPTQKKNFSAIDISSALNVQNEMRLTGVQEAVYIGATSVYLTDFGRLDVVVDRNARDDTIYGIDPNFVKVCAVPGLDFHAVDLAKTGANDKFYTSFQGTLEVSAPKAHWMIEGIS